MVKIPWTAWEWWEMSIHPSSHNISFSCGKTCLLGTAVISGYRTAHVLNADGVLVMSTIPPPLFPIRIPFSHSRLWSGLTWLNLLSFHLTTKFPFWTLLRLPLATAPSLQCTLIPILHNSGGHIWKKYGNMWVKLCKYRSHIHFLWARVNVNRIDTMSM